MENDLLDLEHPSSQPDHIPSNEEIVADITKGLDKCAVKVGGLNSGTTGTVEPASDSLNSLENDSSPDKTDSRVQSHEACSSSKSYDDCEFDGSSDSEKLADNGIPEDFIDEEALKDAELGYSEEERKNKKDEAEKLKVSGNELFKIGNYVDAGRNYTLALRICPLQYGNDRAILYANRAAAKVKLDLKKEAVEDCSKSIELNPSYVKALLRRAQTYESLEKLDEALEDYKNILKIEPYHKDALAAEKRLPYEIEQRNEKMKTEMLSKLKDLGNMILRPFNLSTDNFQLNKDPNSGGYSINFTQNPR